MSILYVNEAPHGPQKRSSKYDIAFIYWFQNDEVNGSFFVLKSYFDIVNPSYNIRSIFISMCMVERESNHIFKSKRIINKYRHDRHWGTNITKSKKALIKNLNSNKRFPIILYLKEVKPMWYGLFFQVQGVKFLFYNIKPINDTINSRIIDYKIRQPINNVKGPSFIAFQKIHSCIKGMPTPF